MTEDLAGKAALVTGGGRGIGAAIALRLARGGADVAVTYVRAGERAAEVVREIEAVGRRGLAIAADAADPVAVAGAVDRAAAEFGRLDILVNNAGIAPYGPLADVTTEELDLTLAVHVRAAFVAAQAAARHLGPGGRIINIGSSLAERVPYPDWTLYAMSKSALTGLTRGLARDLGPRGITANVVQPGSTDTEMNPADSPDAEFERGFTALGRYGRPEEIAATVAHLAGPGGDFVTGAAIAVDGGYAA
ncbi:NAD(P)-dependent dehydrogenase (short-subunit alcohol dehydrogenase family) [Actinomadura pelletieri DSM 43383]|uniref:NAD(P)-dependent dehydrogenase (Short-subunit alcohol dehydrogenase family) n=1 Tax=Actinomadura pelletieri DSM 43383 TaxID=1120940 RepID=A0A495QKT0_9ACTN|nr:SDR family oxidoreductase [Actinomadura pelletieri]RKS73182.1 NAD(P)-dependent dehydrogenase (short-subunit alcohol dehydrogenase family) [Actinomadura pelletieri DSM 43383]